MPNPFIKPEFSSRDIATLPQGHTVTKMQYQGAIVRLFSMQTWLPPKQSKEALTIEERVKNLSRQKYARPKTEVVNEINQRFHSDHNKDEGGDDYNE